MSAEAVKVIVRCRPMNERENKLNCEVVLTMTTDIGQVQLRKPNAKDSAAVKLFTFDGVFFTQDTTEQIYEDICFPLVEGVLNGYNGTVFAYGQTGCGKSYTMMGVEDPPANRGIIPRAFDHIFDHIAVSEGTRYLLTASYLEIYNEEVRDLLGRDVKKRLELHEHPEKGVYVQDLSSHKVHNAQDLSRVMELGSKSRSVGATLMNVDSSRSHSIFTIDIEMVGEGGGGGGGGEGEGGLRAGRLNLVDLAGSERQSKTGSTGERLKEATKINLSLSALGNVISALVDGRSTHIPYRDSKLTRLLQSSLGGNTKTIMVACVSPADNNYDETLSSLRYANRAKNIKNKPRINEDPKDALLRQYREEIDKLKELLSGGGGALLEAMPTTRGESEREWEEEERRRHKEWEDEREAISREYERKMAELRQQYDQVHTDKTKLQDRLSELQLQQQQELENLQNRLNQSTNQTTSGSPGIPPTTDQTRPPGATVNHQQPLLTIGGPGGESRQLLEHEAALRRLEELQGTMIGGERVGDRGLREGLEERRRRAEDKRELLLRASRADDDDGIIEGIFNSLTDEVRAKSRALEKTKMKLRSAEEDISDLQTEFELERQGYLDTIRNQERLLKLHHHLLETVAGLIRRDCNYYNIEKIKHECTWDLDREEWNVPPVTVTKTTLSPVPSHKSLPKKSSSTSTLSTSPSSSLMTKKKGVSPSSTSRRGGGGTITEAAEEEGEGGWRGSGAEMDYFKPKRALELLAEGAQLRGGVAGGGAGSLANSASVHGLETLLASDNIGGSWRRGRLQSLPATSAFNPHSIPQPGLHSIPHPSPHSKPQHDVLETVERKKSKWRSLEPLDKRKPPFS